jgi:hypothetical protein
VAVWRRLGDHLGAHDPARCRAILDDDALAKAFFEVGLNDPGSGIVQTAGRERDDDADDMRGVALRQRGAGSGENPQRGKPELCAIS